MVSTQHGILWRAFVLVSWCLLGLACSDHALPTERPLEKAPRISSLPKQPAPQAGPASANWTAEVQTRMANGQRAIRVDGTNAFRVANRKQGFAAKYDSGGGLHLQPHAGGASEVHVQLASMGREGTLHPVGVTSMALGACGADGAVDEMGTCLKRLEVKRDNGVVEWWESREEGLEQGIVIENRPGGKGLLELHVAVEGARVEFAGERASEATLRVDERTAWSYAGLHVEDARGKALESWMERDDAGGIRIVVEDEEAAYPVVVDPVLSAEADWTAESNQAGAKFGTSVASAGDVNGDGFGDVIIGASGYDSGLGAAGRVFVYLGSAAGLQAMAAWTEESDQANADFGRAVASAGDVNGDGYSDIIVGAPLYDNGETNEGRAYVYLGSALGLSTSPAWTAESDQDYAFFGASVASAGDVNGDGYSDVVIGAYGYDNGQTNEGRAYVYLGSALGLASSSAWTAESDEKNAEFGVSVASAGDVTGDGIGDVVVGAHGNSGIFGTSQIGRAYAYLGSATGLQPTAAWTVALNKADGYFGTSVASAGDVNGDGYTDIIVGASGYGRAYVYLGSPSGVGTTAAWMMAQSNQAGTSFGSSVASAGDVNGDGFGDVIVGADRYDNGEIDEGRAYVYLGSASGLQASAVWTAEANQASARFGVSVSSAGDVNGDGFGDVIVGADRYDNGDTDEGRAYVYFGSGCGNGILNLGEACDDGDMTDGDGCDSNCTATACGNGIVTSGEGCDDGNQVNGDGCDSNCTMTGCSNGILTSGEGCDDGNTVNGDGCDAACMLELGQGCATAGACGSGFCTDHICCDSSCAGPCRACSAQLKGGGSDGECGYFANGTDPEGECVMAPASTCQQDGVCDGNGACRLWASGTSCGSNECAGNVSKLATCDGLGTCLLDPVGTDCGPSGCHPTTGQCIAECTTHTDCSADAFCDAATGQCTPKAPLGMACTASEQCQSAHCVDNVCCNEACDGTCQACSTAAGGSQDGTCGFVVAGTPDDVCTKDSSKPCGNTGQCTGVGSCAFAANGTSCGASSCDNGAEKTFACNGNGMCVATASPCGEYVCNGPTCNTTCTTNSDCITGAYCDNGQCRPNTSLGTSCTVDSGCLSGHCVDTTAGSKVCCESDCPVDPGNPCGNTGKCAATGKCQIPPSGTSCGLATCTDGFWSRDKSCDGMGACVADQFTRSPCFPFQCLNESACKTYCSSDADCVYSYACRNGICSTKSCETQPCLEGETCDPASRTCIPATTAAPSCACQMPGSGSADPRWPITSLAFALLMLRRARGQNTSSRRAA